MSDEWRAMANKFENYRQEVRQGKKGKAAQFWIMYLDLMRVQHQIHTAIQTNDFDMRLNAWKRNAAFVFCAQQDELCKVPDMVCSNDDRSR